ncbi:MAG: ABC transporter ATP-binding protein [Candidatus Limnocylindrales bacterium]
MAPLLEVEDLTFTYRRASEPSLRSVSLTVEAGQVVLVAGPSGCGKSTLIRAMNGLIPHAYSGALEGRVRVDGHVVAEMPLRDVARYVGTVLQDPAKQIVGSTVEAELAFGPENLGLPRDDIRRRIGDVVERTGIQPLVGRETSQLSGGERQLVAVAGALMMQPRIFVVDEPLANLDPATASRLLGLLRAMADRGEAVVIVEHRVEDVMALRPDLVLYLDAGREVYQGPMPGFLAIADATAVKLPFEVILDHARRGLPVGEPRDSARPSVPHEPSAPAASPRLEFADVRAGFDGLEVLHGISAALRPRETVAVLGPNGSGKTTLFRTAMHLLPITSGEILVDGAPTRDRSVADLAQVFGYVFQNPSQMLFARTVREELLFGPRNLHRDPAAFDGLLADILSRTALDQLEDILDRPPLTLSFGQQKRLALAIALAMQPATLLLDEPSAGQDQRTAHRFMDEVSAIPRLESLYFVTHDVDLALTRADRILLLREGRVVADGPPAQVIADEDRWIACNLRPTSLMRANARWRAGSAGFLDAATLAASVVAAEGHTDRPPAMEGGLSSIDGA